MYRLEIIIPCTRTIGRSEVHSPPTRACIVPAAVSVQTRLSSIVLPRSCAAASLPSEPTPAQPFLLDVLRGRDVLLQQPRGGSEHRLALGVTTLLDILTQVLGQSSLEVGLRGLPPKQGTPNDRKWSGGGG